MFWKQFALPLLILLLLSFHGVCRAEQEGDRIKVFLIGEVYPQECPLPLLFDDDPLYDYVAIRTREGPAGKLTHDMKMRYIRLYFPRSEGELRKFSMIFFVDADVSIFSGKQSQQMFDAISEGSAGSFFTFGPEFPSVQSSILGRVVPHDMSVPLDMDWTHRSYKVRFVRGLPPVFTPFIELGVEGAVGIGCGFLEPRTGAKAWGYLVPERYGPWILEWKYDGNGGNCWVVADDLDHSWWGNIHASIHGLSENPWAMDIMSNLILYSADRELPEDVVIVSKARDGFWEYRTEKSIILSLMDWVERFGASTDSFARELAETDQNLVRASDLYINGDYSSALAELEEAKEKALELRDEVLGAKDRALLWVYVIEYLTISGTAVISGFVIWTLMVRRRLYRSVGKTTFDSNSKNTDELKR